MDDSYGEQVFRVYREWIRTRGYELKRIRLRNAYLAGSHRRKAVPSKSRGKSISYVKDADYKYEG